MIEWLLTKLLPYRDIIKEVDGENKLYLRRFFLWRRVKGSTTGDEGGLFLHVIHRQDDDRDPHDHPWNFTTLVLRRGYFDEQWVDCFGKVFVCYTKTKPLRIYRREAEHLHRVKGITPGRPVWTLVFTGPKRREWGFVTENGWQHFAQYLGLL